jgi:Ca-activated chloride channel homolog
MALKIATLIVSVVVLALVGCGKKTGSVPGEAPVAAPTAPGIAIKVNDGLPVDGDVTLSLAATAIAGSEVATVFTGPANASDYIDIVPKGFTQTSGELSYVYIAEAAQGQKLRVVTTPGDYDVRYVAELADGRKVKAVRPLTVTAATATLMPPASASGAEPLSIQWTGPAGTGDYIDVVPKDFAQTSGEIAYAYTASGNPAVFNAPGAPGVYSVRYVLEGPGGRQVLASAPLTVSAPEVSLRAPETARRGESVVVEYAGPNRPGDYIDIVKKGYVATSGELAYFYADGTSANTLTIPMIAGAYDIRYVMEAPDGRMIMAKQTITVD